MADSPETFFVTTRWTLIREAAREDGPGAREALGELLQIYWQPLYRLARRKGNSPEDAQDLVQGFFTRLIEGSPLSGLDAANGRFRAFLSAAFNNWMINAWRRDSRLKRGGGGTVLSLDWQSAETGLSFEPADSRTPDQQFDCDWAFALTGRVLEALEAACREEGSAAHFAHLKDCLAADSSQMRYAELGEKLGVSEGAARVAVHRLRKRYRHLLREEIARTLASPDGVDEEMRALFSALAQGGQPSLE